MFGKNVRVVLSNEAREVYEYLNSEADSERVWR